MDKALSFLEEVLASQRDKAQRVFVFQHVPPPVSSDFRARQMAQPEKLIGLFDKYRVDYVFAGDYHGYARVKRNNTVYLVSGGGGAHLKQSGGFYHVVILKVRPSGVSERIMVVPCRYDVEDWLECNALGRIWPRITSNPGWAALAMPGLLFAACGMSVSLLRYCKPQRKNAPTAPCGTHPPAMERTTST